MASLRSVHRGRLLLVAGVVLASFCLAYLLLSTPQGAFGDGLGSPDSCIEPDFYIEDDGEGDLALGAGLIAWQAPVGWEIASVCVSYGNGDAPTHPGQTGDGFTEDGCVEIEGVGTNMVEVTMVGDLESNCGGLLHIDVFLTESVTPTPTGEPEPTPEPDLCPDADAVVPGNDETEVNYEAPAGKFIASICVAYDFTSESESEGGDSHSGQIFDDGFYDACYTVEGIGTASLVVSIGGGECLYAVAHHVDVYLQDIPCADADATVAAEGSVAGYQAPGGMVVSAVCVAYSYGGEGEGGIETESLGGDGHTEAIAEDGGDGCITVSGIDTPVIEVSIGGVECPTSIVHLDVYLEEAPSTPTATPTASPAPDPPPPTVSPPTATATPPPTAAAGTPTPPATATATSVPVTPTPTAPPATPTATAAPPTATATAAATGTPSVSPAQGGSGGGSGGPPPTGGGPLTSGGSGTVGSPFSGFGFSTPTGTALPATPTPSITPTSTPAATRTPGPTPTGTAAPVSGTSTPVGGNGDTPAGSASNEYRPDFTDSLLDVRDISTSAETLATNFLLALLLMLLVLFDASIINSTIEDNSDFFDGLLARIADPFAPGYAAVGAVVSVVAQKSASYWRYVKAALVLGATSIIYAALEPGFGLNQETFVLMLSLAAGIGITTYAFDGAQVLIAERRFGLDSEILFFPFAILVALLSVLVSRLVHIHPGVIYGFVAAAALTSTVAVDRRIEAQIIYIATLILLGVSVLCWLLIAPLREWSEGGGFLPALLETVAVSVFVGGIQGILFTLVPLDFLDGQKIWNWSKRAWVLVTLPVTFIFVHVILNPNGDFDSPVQETGLRALLIACVVLWLITAVIWLYFRQKSRMTAEPQ